MEPRRMNPGSIRFAMVVAAATCLSPLAAQAQTPLTPVLPPDDVQKGISISAQVDLLFQPPGQSVKMMQTNFRSGAPEESATPNYVFGLLNQAALAGLGQALQEGAQSGRVCVVATSYQVGLGNGGIKVAAPIGVFINTTDMVVVDGKANFRTHVQFIPDGSATGSAPPAGEWQPQLPQQPDPDAPLLTPLPSDPSPSN